MTAELERTLESLLFLSADPVPAEALADATGAELHEVVTALESSARALRVRAPRIRRPRARRRLHLHQPPRRGARRPAAAGQAAHPAAVGGPGRDARDRGLPPAGVAAGDRPHPRRQRRVGGGDAARAGDHRGGRPLAVRGRAVPHHRAVPQAVRSLRRLASCPRSRALTRRPSSSRSCASASCAPARRAAASAMRARRSLSAVLPTATTSRGVSARLRGAHASAFARDGGCGARGGSRAPRVAGEAVRGLSSSIRRTLPSGP